MIVPVLTQNDIRQSVNRLQSTFEGDYGDLPIVEDNRSIGAIRSDQNRIYLTFRGSVNSFWEVLTCLDVRKVSMEQIGLSGRVHHGIFSAFIKTHLFILNELREMNPHKEICIEGYSRGAGIATLMGAYLKTHFPNRSLTVLSYSPMKIFDHAALINPCGNIHNFICKEDLIPSWAPACLGFTRIGKEYTFSALSLAEYAERVRKRTYLHMMPGCIAKIIQCILPARIWEAHMPETYREGAPSLV